jgi:hypothetical protein
MVTAVSVVDSPREFMEVRAIEYELPFVRMMLVFAIPLPSNVATCDAVLVWRSNLEKDP